MEQIARQQGIKWTHVPFKGNAETMNALLGGHIHAVADSSGWAQLVNAGRFRLLVTWGVARTKNWPDVPTLREIGIDMVSNSPFGIAGPKGMDPKIVKVLHDAFKKGMEEPSYADGDRKPGPGAVLFEQRGLPEICDAADRGGQALHRGAWARAEAGIGNVSVRLTWVRYSPACSRAASGRG